MGGAILLACVLRLARLRAQGYWSDELFSIGESSSSLSHLLHTGTTEIHPPLFALLLWVWLHAGGGSTNPDWVRLFPALCGILAIPACAFGLQRTALRPEARRLLTVATACNGMSLVYGQEVRSYSLLFLASVGLTAATLNLLAPAEPHVGLRRFVCWGMLASGTHLFGALLAVACGLALMVGPRVAGRRRAASWPSLPRPARVAVAVGLACLPQLLWLAYGAFVPGFAAGTDWVAAPRPAAVWWWLTTAFGSGGLLRQADGYRLGSPWLILAIVLVALGSADVRRRWRRRRSASDDRRSASRDAVELRCARVLGAVTLVSALAIFAGAQVVHIWLLRNMIAFVPALTWSVLLGVLHLARSRRRALVGVLLVCALAASSVGTWHSIQKPYKDQYAQAADRVADLREQDPDLHVVGDIAAWWFTGSHHAASEAPAILGSMTGRKSPDDWSPPSTWHDIVWVFATTDPTSVAQDILDREGSGCHEVPLVRVAFVECHR